MERSQGRREITIALIDGPVVLSHPDLAGATIREIPGKLKGACTRAETMSCAHGTLVAGILCARRGSMAPAICPGCTLLVRPIFAETDSGNGRMPNATPEELAEAIIDTVDAGAHVINLSGCLRPTFTASGEQAGEGTGLRSQPRRHYHRCGGQSGDGWKFRDHPASLGHSGDSLQLST
jgi:subtilisin family serine protease